MTIAVIATLNVLEGKNEEFEKIFSELEEKVNANEPGCLFYRVSKSRKEPQTYKVLEQYVDQAAIDAHGKTDYFVALGQKLGSCMAGRPEIELLDGI